jgi:hypothetical protein
MIVNLLKKDILFAFLAPVIILPLLTLYWFSARQILDLQMAFGTGNVLLMLAATSVLNIEIFEEKGKGYAFLACLPIRSIDISLAKFVQVLLLNVIFFIYTFVLFFTFSGDAVVFRISLIIVYFYLNISLIVTGFLYVMLYRFGFTKIMMGVLFIVPAVCMMAPIILLEMFEERLAEIEIAEIIDNLSASNIAVIMILVLCGYIGLMLLAAKMKKNNILQMS